MQMNSYSMIKLLLLLFIIHMAVFWMFTAQYYNVSLRFFKVAVIVTCMIVCLVLFVFSLGGGDEMLYLTTHFLLYWQMNYNFVWSKDLACIKGPTNTDYDMLQVVANHYSVIITFNINNVYFVQILLCLFCKCFF